MQYPQNTLSIGASRWLSRNRQTEKSETTKTEENSGGVLSSSVNIVGEVLALPFRAVAGLEVLF